MTCNDRSLQLCSESEHFSYAYSYKRLDLSPMVLIASHPLIVGIKKNLVNFNSYCSNVLCHKCPTASQLISPKIKNVA